jgi:hypothetical protein
LLVDVQKVRFKSTGAPGEVRFSYDYGSGRLTPIYEYTGDDDHA